MYHTFVLYNMCFYCLCILLSALCYMLHVNFVPLFLVYASCSMHITHCSCYNDIVLCIFFCAYHSVHQVLYITLWNLFYYSWFMYNFLCISLFFFVLNTMYSITCIILEPFISFLHNFICLILCISAYANYLMKLVLSSPF